MLADLEPPEGEDLRKAFRLPPQLDMGDLKRDDLNFDLEEEVTRLRLGNSTQGCATDSGSAPNAAGPALECRAPFESGNRHGPTTG